jgi:hypothetical protein
MIWTQLTNSNTEISLQKMKRPNMDHLNSICNWLGIVAAFVTAVSFLGSWITSGIIGKSKDNEIQLLRKTVDHIQPSIYSQELKALNTKDGNRFRHEYTVSINSPNSYMMVNTALRMTAANKVGNIQLNPTGTGGIREINGEQTQYQEYQLQFWTDKEIDEDTANFSVKF